MRIDVEEAAADAGYCLGATRKYRDLKRPIHQEYREQAHQRNETQRYNDLMRTRRIRSEGPSRS